MRKASLEKVILPHGASFFSFHRVETHFPYFWHFHPEYELTLVTRGGGRRFVGSSAEHFKARDLVLLGPNLPHCWVTRPGKERHEAWVLKFSAASVAALSESPEGAGLRDLLKASVQGLAFSPADARNAEKGFQALKARKPQDRLLAFYAMLLGLGTPRKILDAQAPFQVPLLRADRRIEEAIGLYQRHFPEGVPLPEAAKRAGMAPASFSRYFLRHTGRSPSRYLQELRVAHACRLLLERTELGIAGISEDSGFENLSNFNRAFLRLRGMTPSLFRRRFSE